MAVFYGVKDTETGELVKEYFTGRNTKMCCFRTKGNADRASKIINGKKNSTNFIPVPLVEDNEQAKGDK